MVLGLMISIMLTSHTQTSHFGTLVDSSQGTTILTNVDRWSTGFSDFDWLQIDLIGPTMEPHGNYL